SFKSTFNSHSRFREWKFVSLAKQLSTLTIKKEEIEWPLSFLESQAPLMQEEESEEEERAPLS
ncbi:hypothetical protein, partial [Thermoanaerobacterium sp. DL9XJH110]|uniref:hypothetical protein n=1 Tax=Thermoanaerobacterium sp. DL9XJH110 TaxID=3386643 RepID=UPI003BB740FA